MCSLIQQSFDSASLSFFCVPSDVIEQHIFKQLDESSLVASSLVCFKFRMLSSGRLSEPKNNIDQNCILKEIFRNGSLNFLSWFQRRLAYPSMAALSELRPILLQRCLSLAAEGIFIFISIFVFMTMKIRQIFLWNFIKFFINVFVSNKFRKFNLYLFSCPHIY